ncbi:MAG: DUF3096 domain-containing protein [Nanoarchaeota archaeon]|nr:DUF3096 domain-containing protein [Nanoarchaeota archaeon]
MVSTILTISAVLAILIGILVLAIPKFLRYAVGLYLILMGILQLVNLYYPIY